MKNGCDQPAYRLGILGASNIAVPAMLEPAQVVEKVRITAIANRTLEKAVKLAEAYHIPYVAGSLEDLLELGDLEGYILHSAMTFMQNGQSGHWRRGSMYW